MIFKKVHYQKAIALIRAEYDIKITVDGRKDCLRTQSYCWFIDRQSIQLGTQGPPFLVLMALFHELGHCFSVRKGSKSNPELQMKYKFGLPLSKKEKAAILAEEYRAWKFGFKSMRDNGFLINDKMFYLKKLLMNGHIKKLKSQ